VPQGWEHGSIACSGLHIDQLAFEDETITQVLEDHGKHVVAFDLDPDLNGRDDHEDGSKADVSTWLGEYLIKLDAN
jgi:hypothetical protein